MDSPLATNAPPQEMPHEPLISAPETHQPPVAEAPQVLAAAPPQLPLAVEEAMAEIEAPQVLAEVQSAAPVEYEINAPLSLADQATEHIPQPDELQDVVSAPASTYAAAEVIEEPEVGSLVPSDELMAPAGNTVEVTGGLVPDPERELGQVHDEVGEQKDIGDILASQISSLQDEVSRLKSALDEVRSEVQSLKPAPSETAPPNADLAPLRMGLDASDILGVPVDEAPSAGQAAELEAWIDSAMAMDEEASLDDQAEVEKHTLEAGQWAAIGAKLAAGVQQAANAWGDRLALANEQKQKLISPLQEKLDGRHKGLELTHKMLAMRAERVGDITSSASIPAVPVLTRDAWRAALHDARSEEEARKITQARIQEAENARYRAVSEARAQVESARKRVLGFIERQLLPVLDGLDDGRKNSQPIVDSVNASTDPRPQVTQAKAGIEAWFSAFDSMREVLLQVLAEAGVRVLAVPVGQPIDYDKHEPFETVPDPSRQTEEIHSVGREGYEYLPPEGSPNGAPMLLRAAQVVVVKN